MGGEEMWKRRVSGAVISLSFALERSVVLGWCVRIVRESEREREAVSIPNSREFVDYAS
jgi:hypothetical protein